MKDYEEIIQSLEGQFRVSSEWVKQNDEYVFTEDSYGDIQIMIAMGQDEQIVANSSDIARYTIDYVNYKKFPINIYEKELKK